MTVARERPRRPAARPQARKSSNSRSTCLGKAEPSDAGSSSPDAALITSDNCGPFVTSMAADGPCIIGDMAYGGSADESLSFAVRAPDVETFERFLITRADGDSLALDGRYSDETSGQMGPIGEKGWSEASLVVVDASETTRVEGCTSRRRGVAPFPTLVGVPGGRRWNVTADPPFAVGTSRERTVRDWTVTSRLFSILS